MQNQMMGSHGMLVLGNKNGIYLLHLAMRSHSTHQIQLILKIDLEAGPTTRIGDHSFVGDDIDLDNTSSNQVYFLDRSHPANNVPVYTFRPGERFPLIEVVTGDRTSFRGDFVRGHFERQANAPDILTDVTVRVKEILYAQQLQSPAQNVPHPLDSGRLEFLLFGARDEYFISHKITLDSEPTDNGFHQVFGVQERTAERLNFDLTRKVALVEIDGTHASLKGRLPEIGGKFPCQLKELVQGIEVPLPLELEIQPEHYLEVLM